MNFFAATAFSAPGQQAKLLTWMRHNLSPQTQLPYSFYVPEDIKKEVYARMGEPNAVNDIIERVIVEEGLVIYDGAVAQMVFTLLGDPDDLMLAQTPIDIYWKGSLNQLSNLRAGFAGDHFVYDPQHPQAVASDLQAQGERGFIFRVINANGQYNTSDPLDGKTEFEGFPTWPTVHWEDWKPVAGENAWVAMAAIQLYYKKYAQRGGVIDYLPSAVELQLAEELARAALMLQADHGGIRMAPIGTYALAASGTLEDVEKARHWWYEEISTENNISWYAAFRMLHEVTGKDIYQQAMDNIENYLKTVWNPQENYFYQGMHLMNGQWEVNADHFALDVQTWGIAALSPVKIDAWFGEGAAYRMWQKALDLSGARGEDNRVRGVGFTQEHDRVSVEWTAGAVLAANELASYYTSSHPQWARDTSRVAQDLRAGIEELRSEISQDMAAYSYSSRRGEIPFGWNSHFPEILSLASTGWVLFIDNGINPFYLK